MLLTHLKTVNDIDSKINSLHKELENLYQLRAGFFDGMTKKSKKILKAAPVNMELWTKQEYKKLALCWAPYNIEIPKLDVIEKRLQLGHDIIETLVAARPEFANKFGLLLVPPAKLIDFPNHESFRDKQSFIRAKDYVTPELEMRFQNKPWRVLVIYKAPEALDLGNAKVIFDEKRYVVEGYDARALGILEYVAFSLQQPVPSDLVTWTLLLKSYTASDALVPSVSCPNGQYRFELDDPAGILGEERFRPAIEVKA